jgi:hypothetical protein
LRVAFRFADAFAVTGAIRTLLVNTGQRCASSIARPLSSPTLL